MAILGLTNSILKIDRSGAGFAVMRTSVITNEKSSMKQNCSGVYRIGKHDLGALQSFVVRCYIQLNLLFKSEGDI